MTFGEKTDIDKLNNVIIKSDDRIKSIYIDELEYSTYAIYYSSGERVSVEIPSPVNTSGRYEYYKTVEGEKKLLTQTRSYKEEEGWVAVCVSDELNINDPYEILKTIKRSTLRANCLSEYLQQQNGGIDNEAFKVGKQYYLYIIDNTEYLDFEETVKNPRFGWMYKYSATENTYRLYSRRREQFRKEIIAKNILCGVTPYMNRDKDGYNYQINEKDTTYKNVEKVFPTSDIIFDFQDENSNGHTQATYELKDGESIVFSRPSLIEVAQYGSYVRYYYKGSTVNPNTEHTLKAGELLTLYYKANEGDALYTTIRLAEGKIIKPTFKLE